MNPVSWQERLDRATTEAAVLEVARDFVATLEYPEIARLPATCRPRKLIGAADVSGYALDLVRHQCADDDPAAEAIVRLAAFFSHASMRLSQILMRTNDEDDSLQQTA